MLPDRAQTYEIEPAFRLLLRHLPELERAGCVARAVDLVHQGQLDPAGIFVLRGASTLLGAIVCAPVPGAGAVVWPPAVAGLLGPAEEDLLVRAACDWLQQQGARIAQALLSDGEAPFARPLLRNGFAGITRLSYLQRRPALPSDPTALSQRLHFEPFDPAHPELFHQTLLRTYEETLDCPEVNGVRTVEEVIQGHQAQGCFSPHRWWLARCTAPRASPSSFSSHLPKRDLGEPVGVLILSAVAEAADWEVSYMGIVPDARRQGLGREMLLLALHQAHAAGARRVALCVDDRNFPAWGLYRSMGFELYDRREVFLAIWGRRS
jgi:ribosomal protein S18 acetylase RimI-like enzyme